MGQNSGGPAVSNMFIMRSTSEVPPTFYSFMGHPLTVAAQEALWRQDGDVLKAWAMAIVMRGDDDLSLITELEAWCEKTRFGLVVDPQSRLQSTDPA